MPDIVQVALEMQKLAQQEEIGRGIADMDFDTRLGSVAQGLALCKGAVEQCSEDFAGGREKNGRDLNSLWWA